MTFSLSGWVLAVAVWVVATGIAATVVVMWDVRASLARIENGMAQAGARRVRPIVHEELKVVSTFPPEAAEAFGLSLGRALRGAIAPLASGPSEPGFDSKTMLPDESPQPVTQREGPAKR